MWYGVCLRRTGSDADRRAWQHRTGQTDRLASGQIRLRRRQISVQSLSPDLGYQLTAENANERNLITGTRYLNIEGMLPFENQVADYVQQTGNHVLYRVTPVFEGDNLLVSGVLMEGYSVEDSGTGICFCVYAYNVQPGVQIDYSTGESALADTPPTESIEQVPTEEESNYVLNNNTRKFHLPSCSSVKDIKASNRDDYSGSREALIEKGYVPCKRCRP